MIALEPVASLSILLASVLGSAHCGGMCGGFVSLYAHHNQNSFRSHLLYNLGRLVTYLSLGAFAGILGGTLDEQMPLARVSAAFVGAVLITVGLLQLLTLPKPLAHTVTKLSHRFSALLGKAMKPVLLWHSPTKPLFIGAITTLLPCGWLYAFIALALAAADPFSAVAIMVVFWLGTLPVMVGIGITSRSLSTALAKRRPTLTALLLVLAGLLSLGMHLQHRTADPASYCHSPESSSSAQE